MPNLAKKEEFSFNPQIRGSALRISWLFLYNQNPLTEIYVPVLQAIAHHNRDRLELNCYHQKTKSKIESQLARQEKILRQNNILSIGQAVRFMEKAHRIATEWKNRKTELDKRHEQEQQQLVNVFIREAEK